MADLTRLMLPFADGAISLPESGTIAILSATDADYAFLPKDRIHAVQTFYPTHAKLLSLGLHASATPPSSAALAILHITRFKDENRALLSSAFDLLETGSQLIVDGAKTDGIESLLKAVKGRHTVDGQVSKSHGKVFWLTKSDTANPFSDWAAPLEPAKNTAGFFTSAGVFSADKVDPGSAELAPYLSGKLKGKVADLGAGWGWLAAQALTTNPQIDTLDLIEAEHKALECARLNVTDPRATFHWADATQLAQKRTFDVVITNPPFHATRQSDPSLGRAFIQSAAGILKPTGHLFLVANRHLAYESTLNDCFVRTEVLSQSNRYKVIHARKPK